MASERSLALRAPDHPAAVKAAPHDFPVQSAGDDVDPADILRQA